MANNSAFGPNGPTVLVGVSAVQVQATQNVVVQSYRVRCLVTGYLTWGPTNSVTSVGAPAAGVPSANTLGMTAGNVESFCLPNGWFIASGAGAFELTPGEGV